ncbi:hypothetical protein [Orrella daihaiensis]|uniref:SdpI/YhfL family protein n=1 Tax=Orrella daihaiensis TaxID=2782176 RepID=A0ABY4AKT0_9BURK|nr:hypothetical protein [Orrella daihaiensis]UOD50894.1 hypothetical protein DHf2319_02930 [Orrella daihaiensis]
MVPDIATVIFWMLFLALFPISFVWLRRAYRIIRKKDYSEVALIRGEPPPNPKRYAPFTAAVNLIAGLVLVSVILSVVLWIAFGIVIINPDFQNWVAVAGSTLWMKIIFDFLISRQAKVLSKRDAQAAQATETKKT